MPVLPCILLNCSASAAARIRARALFCILHILIAEPNLDDAGSGLNMHLSALRNSGTQCNTGIHFPVAET